MPISLGPLSRRQFLAGALAATVGMSCRSRSGSGGKLVDLDRFALLSDTHLSGDKTYTHKTGAMPWPNIQKINGEILSLDSRPAGVMVCGDVACLQGKPEDYATVVDAAKPLNQAGLTVHYALGNHDHREAFWDAIRKTPSRQRAVGNRHISIIGSRHANWFLLDSLEETNKTPGLLGEQQLAWLAKALDERADKPAIVMVHHDPMIDGKGGLKDTDALMQVLLPRRHVKAYVFGHTHVWQNLQREGLHLVNLPTTAWVFDARRPQGWVDVRLQPNGATFQLNSLDTTHQQHTQTLELVWR